MLKALSVFVLVLLTNSRSVDHWMGSRLVESFITITLYILHLILNIITLETSMF